MASSSACPSVPFSSSTRSWKYDVFLSFRVEDTRRNMTDHLRTELKRFGIETFIDNPLRRGEQISPTRLQAIEDSRFSIIIFSQNYASSSWCLDELSKILECVHKGKHTAFPVFHDVNPSDVRDQRGSYAEAFQKHEETYKNNMEKVRKWREVVTEASGYSGWNARNRHLSKVIKEIGFKIFKAFVPRNPSSSSMEHMVGMYSRVEDVYSLLCLGSPEVRMVGIWGMSGIGKTAIAENIYQLIIHTGHPFEGCFLSNVREKSQRNENLQMELLLQILREKNLHDRIFNLGYNSIRKVCHSKKVLIVLDDVDDIKQLEELVGHRDWFGPGSRIIITTTNKRLLVKKGVDAVYEAKELQNDEALELFCQHAFKHESPKENFEDICHKFLCYTKGNPLAIKILGSFLYERSIKEWESELKTVKRIPYGYVQQVFRVSFDGLHDNEKNIFLDIACFFKGEDKDHISEILDSCDFSSATGISILKERALITISEDNRLCMHDLIQEMGWEIVRQQSAKDPGKRNRLWLNEDIKDVLTTNLGTKTLQGIALNLSTSKELDFNVDVFTAMINLRVLKIYVMPKYYFRGKQLSTSSKMHLRGDFKFISKNLRYLQWEGYPLRSLPSNFYPEMLLELDMRFSQLEQLWEGNKPFSKLRCIDLSHSQDLIRTPDLSRAPELRKINFEGCTSLVQVHPSIESLEKLSFLNLKNCSKLDMVAKSFCKLTSLERVNFSGCSELRKLPNDIRMSSLDLDLSGCSKLEELQKSICELTSLETLNVKGCANMKKLPYAIWRLQSLKKLVADGSGIQEVPHSISRLTRLKVLSLEGCKGGGLSLTSSFPGQGLWLPSFAGFQSLYRLNLSDCNLQEGAQPSGLSSLCSLQYLDLSGNNFITLPNLTPLTQLRILNLKGCKRLRSLKELLPSSIETVVASNCESLETFSHPRNAYARSQFDFSNCGRLVEKEESVSLKAILHGIRAIPRSHGVMGDKRFNAVVPGSRIPQWFIHQSLGNSIIVELPPGFHDRLDYPHDALGMAYCVVLGENLPRWHSSHMWLGFSYIEDFLHQAPSKRVSHLKFSFGGYDGKASLVVKGWGIRLLLYKKKWNRLGDIAGHAIALPSSLAFDEERCCITTIEETYHEPTKEDDDLGLCWCKGEEKCPICEHTLTLRIEVEGYNINVSNHVMAASLTQDSNQPKTKEMTMVSNSGSFVPGLRLPKVFSHGELCWKNDLDPAEISSNERYRLELEIKDEDYHNTLKPFNDSPVEVSVAEDDTAIYRSLTEVPDIPELPFPVRNNDSPVEVAVAEDETAIYRSLTEVPDIPELPFPVRNLLDLLLSSISPRQGAWLPSHLSLSSLKELNLSDCSLQEGALPSDISSLWSLAYLDLSRNNFITLPSLTALIRLHELKLEHCKSLRLLTKLPSGIRTLRAQNCKALEAFSHPPNSYAMWKSGELEFDFLNCPQLLKHEGGVSLEAILWGIRISAPSPPSWSLSKAQRTYNAVAVGSRIPEWFIHQSMGNSITLKLPPDFDDARPMGLAFCAVLGKNTQKNSQSSHFEDFKPLVEPAPMHSLKHDHVWFGYASLPEIWSPEECGYYQSAFLESILANEDNIDIDEADMDHFWCGVHPNIDHLKVSFTGDDGVSPEVRKCGVHLLYEPEWREVMKNLPHSQEVIEYAGTVDATSCPRTLFFEDERCWEEYLEVGRTSARFGLEIKVEGYHKKVARPPKHLPEELDPVTRLRDSFWKRKRARLAQVAIPVDAALIQRKLVSTSDNHVEPAGPESLPRPVQAPSLDEAQDNLKQHPCILVTQSGMSNRPNIPPPLPRTSTEQTLVIPAVQPDAAVSPTLTLQNLASDHASQLVIAGLMARMGEVSRLEVELDLISRERACLKEELDRARDLATSSQEEADERVRKLALNNKALQAKVDQLVAERNAPATDHGEVSAERDDQADDD